MGGGYELRIGEHLPEQPDELQQRKTPTFYERVLAVEYALFFCKRVCSDGVVMSGEHHNVRKPGELLKDIEPVDDENDCTHFVSCSVGRPPPFENADGKTLKGGNLGLDPAGFYKRYNVYGQLRPIDLERDLRLGSKATYAHVKDGVLSFDPQKPMFFSNTTSAISELKDLVQARFSTDKGKGDVIIYYRDPEGDPPHSAILVDDDWGIACHTGSRCGAVPINDVSFSKFVYMRIKEFKQDVL